MSRSPKRKAAFDADQMSLGLDPMPTLASDGMLSGLDRQVSSAVSKILKDDERDRFDVSAAMSRIMDADVSKSMLDKYSSETSEEHNISFARFLVLIAATGRHDILRAMLRKIGCDLVAGEEILLVELGHLESQRRQIDERLKAVKAVAAPLTRGRGR